MKKNIIVTKKSLILPSDLSASTRAKLFAFVDALAAERPDIHPRIKAGILQLNAGGLSFVFRKGELEMFDRWFWGMTQRNEKTNCWEWQGLRDVNGYGRFKVAGRRFLAHRASLMLVTGADPDLDGLHRCNNPPCVNPFHLYWGTHQQNMLDRLQHEYNTNSS